MKDPQGQMPGPAAEPSSLLRVWEHCPFLMDKADAQLNAVLSPEGKALFKSIVSITEFSV